MGERRGDAFLDLAGVLDPDSTHAEVSAVAAKFRS
jgi:hypothetical protein